MRHGPACVALLACAAAAWPLSARADTLTAADCAAPTSTSDAALCMAAEYARLDAALDRLQADTAAALADTTDCVGDCAAARAALDDAQTAWRRVRTRDCDAAYALAIDGSGRNDARLTCLIDHTRLCIGQLQQLRAL